MVRFLSEEKMAAAELTVTLAQMSCVDSLDDLENVSMMFGRIEDVMWQARSTGDTLVVFPALTFYRYFPQTIDPRYYSLASPISGELVNRLRELANKTGVGLISSIYELRAPCKRYLTAIALDHEGCILTTYSKSLIPLISKRYERYYFLSEPFSLKIFRIGTIRCAMFFGDERRCFERSRQVSACGAEAIFYLGSEPSSDVERLVEDMKTVSVANGVYTFFVNRCGIEDELTFCGGTLAVSPEGKLLGCAGSHDSFLRIKVEPDRIAMARRKWPFWRDLRVETYQKTGLI